IRIVVQIKSKKISIFKIRYEVECKILCILENQRYCNIIQWLKFYGLLDRSVERIKSRRVKNSILPDAGQNDKITTLVCRNHGNFCRKSKNTLQLTVNIDPDIRNFMGISTGNHDRIFQIKIRRDRRIVIRQITSHYC